MINITTIQKLSSMKMCAFQTITNRNITLLSNILQKPHTKPNFMRMVILHLALFGHLNSSNFVSQVPNVSFNSSKLLARKTHGASTMYSSRSEVHSPITNSNSI